MNQNHRDHRNHPNQNHFWTAAAAARAEGWERETPFWLNVAARSIAIATAVVTSLSLRAMSPSPTPARVSGDVDDYYASRGLPTWVYDYYDEEDGNKITPREWIGFVVTLVLGIFAAGFITSVVEVIRKKLFRLFYV